MEKKKKLEEIRLTLKRVEGLLKMGAEVSDISTERDAIKKGEIALISEEDAIGKVEMLNTLLSVVVPIVSHLRTELEALDLD